MREDIDERTIESRIERCAKNSCKSGTSLLTHENGKMNLIRMDRLALAISELMNENRKLCLFLQVPSVWVWENSTSTEGRGPWA